MTIVATSDMHPSRRGSTTAHVIWASVLGTAIEWYDFLIYGTAAALVLNRLFFPSFDPFVGTLAAFSTYAVGFIARPIGGAVIAHYGDRLGRKSMLVLTMVVMGASTFLIGCLPTYDKSECGLRSCSLPCASCKVSASAANGAAPS
jgi:MFS family permease